MIPARETITVKVRSIALLRSLIGQAELDVSLAEGAEIGDLLPLLAERGDGELAQHLAQPVEKSAHEALRVMVNGRDIAALNGRQTVLKDGDVVLLMIPIAGG